MGKRVSAAGVCGRSERLSIVDLGGFFAGVVSLEDLRFDRAMVSGL